MTKLSETTNWQEIDVENPRFGSFQKAKIQILRSDAIVTNQRKKVRVTHVILPNQHSYAPEGREFTLWLKKEPILRIRTENCGLGSAKAEFIRQSLGFRRA